LEELRKKFIVEENLEGKKLEEYVKRALPFCKMTKNGEVIIEIENATSTEKLKLALVAKLLASHLDKNISSETNFDNLSKSLDIPRDQVIARLKELKDNKFALRVDKGKYKLNPLKIGKFLSQMEKKYGKQEK
jgi:hypothetical protein